MKLFQPIQGSIESKETQENLIDRGQLQVNVTSSVNAFPVKEARISISYTGIPESILEQVVTDSSGQTELVELNAPPEEWSLDENEERQPYSEYTLNIEAEGFESISVSGTEILANTKAIQNIRMKQKDQSREEEQVFVIPAHTLYGNYPPKIAEEEIKPVNETGEIVLSRVVVPEYIIVHDGSPRDSTAQNYYVKYKDYIKNSNTFYKNVKGVKTSLKVEGNKIIYEVDIQYSQDYMKDLVEAGLVSTNGSYKDIDYISLKDTIENQKSAGLTCKEK